MPRVPRVPQIPWVLAVLGVGAVVWSLRPSPRENSESAECETVVLVEGRLVCGDEQTFEEACGTHQPLRAGDAVEDCQLGRMGADDLAALHVAVDPNEADAHELQSLPGVGPVLAQRIVAGRPYPDAESLLEVKGVGPRTLARIRSRLRLPNRGP